MALVLLTLGGSSVHHDAMAAPAGPACRRELWILADVSGSMYLPGERFRNLVNYQGRKRNLLEVSALVIDEAIAGLPDDVRVRIFDFYATTQEVPRPAGSPKGRWFFSFLDRNQDGRLDRSDDPGGFQGESKTNLAGAFETAFKELAALPEDGQQAVGILLFTDGEADYVPPGYSKSGRDYLRETCNRYSQPFTSHLRSRNAALRVVALHKDLVDAEQLVACLKPSAGDRVEFLEPSSNVADVVRGQLDALIMQLSKLNVRFSGFERADGTAQRMKLDVSNTSCSSLDVSRATLVFRDGSGKELDRVSVPRADKLAPGESVAISASFDAASVNESARSVECILENSSQREVGRLEGGAARYVDERISWSIEAVQAGLGVTGRIGISSRVAAPATVKLSSFQLVRASDHLTFRVPIEGKVWEQVAGDSPSQGSDFEFHFQMPPEALSGGNAEYAIEPDLVVSRSIRLKRDAVRVQIDPSLGLGSAGQQLVYRMPELEQAPVADRQRRERDLIWTIPLRIIRNQSFVEGPLGLEKSVVVAEAAGGELPLPGVTCKVDEGNICLWTLTGSELSRALGVKPVGSLDVTLRLRSDRVKVAGETRFTIERPAPVAVRFAKPLVRRNSTEPAVLQARFEATSSIPARDLAGIASISLDHGWLAAAPYFRAQELNRLVREHGGKVLAPAEEIPLVWLEADGFVLQPRSNTRAVSFECQNRSQSLPVTLQLDIAPAGIAPTQAKPGSVQSIVCAPGTSTQQIELPAAWGMNVARLRLSAATSSPESLWSDVTLLLGSREVLWTGGDVYVVFQRNRAWGLLGLIAIALIGAPIVARWFWKFMTGSRNVNVGS